MFMDVQDAYDDKMVANIELKSQDFDDENFSPVFNRKTQEYFLEPSEKFKSDHAKVKHQGHWNWVHSECKGLIELIRLFDSFLDHSNQLISNKLWINTS
jgi:hypothetical protein